MNYRPADLTNTGKTYEPLAAFMKSMLEPGMICAKEMYGAGGWAMHHVTDIYGRTSINADPMWGTSPLAGAWMALSLFDHYAFTRDDVYLRSYAWPLLKGSADFIMDFLIPDMEGHLVTAPSMSPENGFYLNKDSSTRHVITYAPAIDIQIIHELFSDIRSISGTIGIPDDYLRKMNVVEAKLPPISINSYGGIQEWIKDYEEEEPGHRHMSQLFGLYPGTTITKDSSLMVAARKTLGHRLAKGGGHTGWSRAWMISFYARLKDGEQAGFHLEQLLKKSTLSNLFDTHPPFQIDGNFGGIAGIGEMFLQSHQEYIELLPALPAQWQAGSVNGLMARGNFIVSMQWKDGKLVRASFKSNKGLPLKVKYGNKLRSFIVKMGDTIILDGNLNMMNNSL
jgi:alpha-L-fucosidase 2